MEEKIPFFTHTCQDNSLSVELVDNTHVDPEDLELLHTLKNDVNGSSVVLKNRGSVETYFAMGYYFALWGAKEISAIDANGKQTFLKPDNATAAAEKKDWFKVKNGNCIQFLSSPSAEGKWSEEELNFSVPAKLPTAEEAQYELSVSGRGSVLMYAALGIAVAQAGGFKKISLQKPAIPYRIVLTPDSVSKELFSCGKKGVVIGIVGDPCSGKSVFSRIFYRAISQALPSWYTSWIYDCDKASPTPEWYMNSVNEKTSSIRTRIKRAWTSDLEAEVVQDLQVMRSSLDLSIADMPGGDHKSDPMNPQRIPTKGKRVEMMQCCDAFIVLSKSDAAYDGWYNALKSNGLEKKILARINSQQSETFSVSELKKHSSGVFEATISGLNRTGDKPAMIAETIAKLTPLFRYISYINIAGKARAATVQAFLTGIKGTRYGAVVRSAASGNIFSSGQYSSFNHSTNIHAEMSALTHAAMAGEPDIDVLAIASTSKDRAVPCGVCRQVMMEHSTRTGRDFDVVMVSGDGWFNVAKISELLPYSWRPLENQKRLTREMAEEIRQSFTCKRNHSLSLGGIILEKKNGKNLLRMIWDPMFNKQSALLKTKYESDDELIWEKLPHSFTEGARYKKYQIDNNLCSDSFPGAELNIRQGNYSYIPPVPLPAEDPQYKFIKSLFSLADISVDTDLRLTCSRMLKVNAENSDYDFVVSAPPEKIRRFREILALKIEANEIRFPEESQSVRFLGDSLGGEKSSVLKRIVKERRYVETFALADVRFSVMWVPPNEEIAFPHPQYRVSRVNLAGTIRDASYAPYKRSSCLLETNEHETVRLLCYHKVGSMLKSGDEIAVSGMRYENPHSESIPTLLLLNPFIDKIVWFK